MAIYFFEVLVNHRRKNEEVAFWRTFSLGNNRDYTNGAGTKLLLSQPLIWDLVVLSVFKNG